MKNQTIIDEIRGVKKLLQKIKSRLEDPSTVNKETGECEEKGKPYLQETNRHLKDIIWILVVIIGFLAALFIVSVTSSTIKIEGAGTDIGLDRNIIEESIKGDTYFNISSDFLSSTIDKVSPNQHSPTSKEYMLNKLTEQTIECESNGRHLDKNGNLLVGDRHLPYPTFGVAQYQKRTFSYLSQLAGRPELNIENKQHQIWLLKWAIKNDLGRYWSCYDPVVELTIN